MNHPEQPKDYALLFWLAPIILVVIACYFF